MNLGALPDGRASAPHRDSTGSQHANYPGTGGSETMKKYLIIVEKTETG
jgi:hypothetical protein